MQRLTRDATIRIAWLSNFCAYFYWGNPVLFGVWDGSCAPFLGRDSFFENSSRIRVGRSGMDPGAFRLVESYRGKEIGCHESWAAISEKDEKHI